MRPVISRAMLALEHESPETTGWHALKTVILTARRSCRQSSPCHGPLYLEHLGQERFGVWVIAGLVIAYFGLLDRGLGTAVQNRSRGSAISRERSRHRSGRRSRQSSSSHRCRTWSDRCRRDSVRPRDRDPESLRVESVESLPVFAASVPFVAVSGISRVDSSQRERIATLSLLETGSDPQSATAPTRLHSRPRADLRWLGRRRAGRARDHNGCLPHRMPRARVEASPVVAPVVGGRLRLFHYGKWVTVTSVLTRCSTSSDRVVIGAIRGAVCLHGYSIPYNLASASRPSRQSSPGWRSPVLRRELRGSRGDSGERFRERRGGHGSGGGDRVDLLRAVLRVVDRRRRGAGRGAGRSRTLRRVLDQRTRLRAFGTPPGSGQARDAGALPRHRTGSVPCRARSRRLLRGRTGRRRGLAVPHARRRAPPPHRLLARMARTAHSSPRRSSSGSRRYGERCSRSTRRRWSPPECRSFWFRRLRLVPLTRGVPGECPAEAGASGAGAPP